MSTKARTALAGFALVLLVAAIYARTLRHEFVSIDTFVYLTGNPVVARGLSLEGARWALTSFHAANWHPLTWLSHMLDVSLFGLEPAGHHAVNAALHAANAVLLFAFLSRTTSALATSFVAAALFAAHPLRVESVAWVVERKDVLSTLFGLAALLSWSRFVRDGSRRAYAGALVLFALGLASKPMLVTWPFVWLVLDRWPFGRAALGAWRLVLEKAPFFALSAASCVVTFLAQSSAGAVNPLERVPVVPRVANAIDACGQYLRKSVWPSDLAFFYPHPGAHLSLARSLAALAAVLAISAAAFAWRRRAPAVLSGWLVFLGTLVPVIGIVQVGGQAFADRYTYLPSIGLSIAVAFGARELVRARPALLGAARVAAALVVATLAALAWRQAGTWRDSATLARHAIEVTRDNYKAHHMLGYSLAEEGSYDEAMVELREALRLEPGDLDARDTLSTVLSRLGRIDESERELRIVLKNDPDQPAAVEHLAILLHVTNRHDEALPLLERAARRDRGDATVATYLGEELERRGDDERARAEWKRALALAPGDVRASVDLARSWLDAGDAEAAARLLEPLAAGAPDAPQVHQQLARAQLARGDERAAAAALVRARELRPGWPLAIADLARIRATARATPPRDLGEARALADLALERSGSKPDAEVLEAIADVRASLGQGGEARELLERALARAREEGRARVVARLEARLR